MRIKGKSIELSTSASQSLSGLLLIAAFAVCALLALSIGNMGEYTKEALAGSMDTAVTAEEALMNAIVAGSFLLLGVALLVFACFKSAALRKILTGWLPITIGIAVLALVLFMFVAEPAFSHIYITGTKPPKAERGDAVETPFKDTLHNTNFNNMGSDRASGAEFWVDGAKDATIAIGFLMAAVLLGLLATASVVAIREAGKKRMTAEPDSAGIAETATMVSRFLDGAKSYGAERDAVIEAYQMFLAEINKELGREKDATMTPREFEREIARLGIDARSMDELTRLFELARYSGKSVPSGIVDEAKRCYDDIVECCVRYAAKYKVKKA